MSSAQFDLSWMIGRSITSIALQDPSQWIFMFEDSIGIGAECPWRLLKDGQVAISDADHNQQYGLPASLDAAAEASRLLASQTVKAVEVRDGTADLLISLTGGLRLEILPFSSGYESWDVTTPTGFRIVAQGGGQLSGWQG